MKLKMKTGMRHRENNPTKGQKKTKRPPMGLHDDEKFQHSEAGFICILIECKHVLELTDHSKYNYNIHPCI